MFKINELQTAMCPHVALEVEGLEALPHALKRLAELGYNMETSLEVLREAVDNQRKQKVLQAAINALVEPVKK